MPHIGYFPFPPIKPLAIPPGAFVPGLDTYDCTIDHAYFQNRTTTSSQKFYAPVFLPQGASVWKLVICAYRNTETPNLTLKLYRYGVVWGVTLMATVAADWTGGEGSKGTTEITEPLIDNTKYAYSVEFDVDPNGGAVADAKGIGARIHWR